MIYGIGIDIIEINRIKKIVLRSGNKLAKRILSEFELKEYLNEKYPISFLSKRFAVKEAASKAFGIGINKGVKFNQFEIFNDDLGKPKLNLISDAAWLAKKISLKKTHVTLSDTQMYACAIVILES